MASKMRIEAEVTQTLSKSELRKPANLPLASEDQFDAVPRRHRSPERARLLDVKMRPIMHPGELVQVWEDAVVLERLPRKLGDLKIPD